MSLVMDKEVDQERELEEPSSAVSVSPGTHKSIFDLPAEIITHIVSFLSLQGKTTDQPRAVMLSL